MKIIHCADVHLSSNLMTNLDKERAKNRNIELLMNFERMVEYAEENFVQAIMLVGDLFDDTVVSSYILQQVLDIIKIHEEIDFFYVRGNHDRTVFEDWTGSFPDNLILFQKHFKSFLCGEVVISGMECEGVCLDQTLEQVYFVEDKINIMMLHGRVVEKCEASVLEDQIPLSKLRNKHIDYLALGHIHSYSEKRLDERGRYCYSGCLEGRGFDECGQKGFVLLDIVEESKKIRTTFLPFTKRMLYEEQLAMDAEMTKADMEELIKQKLYKIGCNKEDYVKIKLTGEMSQDCQRYLWYLKKKFEQKYYYFQVVDETNIKDEYHQFAEQETLKGEFIRLVEGSTYSESDKREIIRLGMNALTGEELEICN